MTTAELMGQVADRLAGELETVVAEMVDEILTAEPTLGTDAALVAELGASCRANIHRYVTVARRYPDFPAADVPPEALDVARTFVRRGVDSALMYGAYRRGQQVLW